MNSSNALANATTARMANAVRQPNMSEINVPTGMPNTVAQTMPKPIFSMARPAYSGPTMSTAVSLAKAQNTGNPSAGINRANAITQIFGASAATVLAMPNMIRMLINKRLRGKRAQYAVRNGPNAATVKANKVTNNPAWDTLTFRSRAIDGSRPTMTNSVVNTVKPAADSSRMGNNMKTPETTTSTTARRAR